MTSKKSTPILIKNRIYFFEYLSTLFSLSSVIKQLTQKTIIARYKQKLLGVLWVLLEPLLNLLVLTLIFGVLFGQIRSSDSEVPYVLFLISGLMVWQLFALVINASAESLLANIDLLTQIYFPKVILPFSASFAAVVDFSITFVLFLILLLGYGATFTWRFLAIIPILIITYLLAFGPGLIIASLNVKFRDFNHILPLIIRVGFYFTPIAWTSSMLPDWAQPLYPLNPLAGIIDSIRWTFFGIPFPINSLVSSVIIAVVFLAIGMRMFITQEQSFADNA